MRKWAIRSQGRIRPATAYIKRESVTAHSASSYLKL